MPTDFGVFVAECVRRNSGADLAILNAGAFRCDTRLPARLRLRELRDTFLYDSDQAVLVLDLPRYAIDAALVHGRGKAGSGGYPQVAPDELPEGDRLRVAIASYLITDDKSIDGYDVVFAQALEVTPQVFRAEASAAVQLRYSIIDAVLAQRAQVQYRKIGVAEAGAPVIGNFIATVNQFVRDLNEPWSQMRFAALMSDDSARANSGYLRLRDALQRILLQLPEAQALYNPSPECPDNLKSAAVQNLFARCRALRKELETHPERFRNRIPYYKIFDDVAEGIGAWMN
jgi:hypothetical protein